jgi:hypothetical protein
LVWRVSRRQYAKLSTNEAQEEADGNGEDESLGLLALHWAESGYQFGITIAISICDDIVKLSFARELPL